MYLRFFWVGGKGGQNNIFCLLEISIKREALHKLIATTTLLFKPCSGRKTPAETTLFEIPHQILHFLLRKIRLSRSTNVWNDLQINQRLNSLIRNEWNLTKNKIFLSHFFQKPRMGNSPFYIQNLNKISSSFLGFFHPLWGKNSSYSREPKSIILGICEKQKKKKFPSTG